MPGQLKNSHPQEESALGESQASEGKPAFIRRRDGEEEHVRKGDTKSEYDDNGSPFCKAAKHLGDADPAHSCSCSCVAPTRYNSRVSTMLTHCVDSPVCVYSHAGRLRYDFK